MSLQRVDSRRDYGERRVIALGKAQGIALAVGPQATGDALTRFFGAEPVSTKSSQTSVTQPASTAGSSSLPQIRLTPAEVRANQTGSDQIGSSGLAGVSTKVLFGDPSKAGFYTIVLFVPARTTIPAHLHRDDRMATVVSGTWHFGYGKRFDESALKSLHRVAFIQSRAE
jgi:hypothetical protein